MFLSEFMWRFHDLPELNRMSNVHINLANFFTKFHIFYIPHFGRNCDLAWFEIIAAKFDVLNSLISSTSTSDDLSRLSAILVAVIKIGEWAAILFFFVGCLDFAKYIFHCFSRTARNEAKLPINLFDLAERLVMNKSIFNRQPYC